MKARECGTKRDHIIRGNGRSASCIPRQGDSVFPQEMKGNVDALTCIEEDVALEAFTLTIPDEGESRLNEGVLRCLPFPLDESLRSSSSSLKA